ncbi:MAG TPA: putative metallopeptidase [Armatimonadota bacterium]|jgi:hypothetical protein
MLDFTGAMKELMADIVVRCPELNHIRLDQVLVGLNRARKSDGTGQLAKICPLRFEGGRDWMLHRRYRYVMPRLMHQGQEVLYVIYFCMPKFQNLALEDKLLTVFHEMYHISPEFNGDVRRFPGRKFAHGYSRESYNAKVRRLVEAYLGSGASSAKREFLEPSFRELERRYSGVAGLKVPQPRPLLERVPSEPSTRKPQRAAASKEG